MTPIQTAITRSAAVVLPSHLNKSGASRGFFSVLPPVLFVPTQSQQTREHIPGAGANGACGGPAANRVAVIRLMELCCSLTNDPFHRRRTRFSPDLFAGDACPCRLSP
eukprot:8492972-Pyramimonas_sp.AAC.1